MHKIIGRLSHNILMMLCLGKGINHIHIFSVSLGLAALFFFFFLKHGLHQEYRELQIYFCEGL